VALGFDGGVREPVFFSSGNRAQPSVLDGRLASSGLGGVAHEVAFSPAQTHEAGLVRRLRLCAVAGHGLSSQLSAKGPYAEIPQARLDTAWQAGRAVCEQSMGPIS
jgi:hypothetical protein